MKKISIASFAALSVCYLSGMALAASLDTLQGAWMMGGQDCGTTFEKKDGAIRFRDASSSLATGIIISGQKITGPNGVCTVRRIREGNDGKLSLSMSCADAVLASGMSVSLRIVDHDTIEVSDFAFPEEMQSYNRCPL